MKDMHGIIFAYSRNSNLKELIQHRTASSIPFAGCYRVIDFMLSCMVNAGVTDVGVIMLDRYQSLLDHLGSGKAWDLSRKRGGLRLLPPLGYGQGQQRETAFKGKMDALAGVLSYIQRIKQKYIILADGNLIANLPLDDIYASHIKSRADITAVCTKNLIGDPDASTYLTLDDRKVATDVCTGMKNNDGCESVDVYVLEASLLRELIPHCISHNMYSFERDVLQKMRNTLTICGYVHDGYAVRMQNIPDYFKQSMNILTPKIRRELFNPERPVMTKERDDSSTYYGSNSKVINSLVADGCMIDGEIYNSILFRGVRVEEGAKIENCILMQDTVVRKNSALNYVIADKDVRVNEGRMLMGHDSYPLTIAKGSSV